LKKLVHLLAVSAGGVLLIGVGIRLAERLWSEVFPDRTLDEPGDRISSLVARIESLERRISSLALAGRPDRDSILVDPISCAAQPNRRRKLTAQIEAMEQRLKRDLEQRHEHRLGQMSDALERRITERIAPIEAAIEGQHSAVGELRQSSLRTETSLQKLLEGIEKLIASPTFSKSPGNFTP
jgi:hypothetical protein